MKIVSYHASNLPGARIKEGLQNNFSDVLEPLFAPGGKEPEPHSTEDRQHLDKIKKF